MDWFGTSTIRRNAMLLKNRLEPLEKTSAFFGRVAKVVASMGLV